jgi:hypothetical protein
MADLLATPSDLASVLQEDVDTATATLLLETATAAVQGVTGQRLVQVVADSVTIDLDELDDHHYLYLPEQPVTAVTSAAIGSTAVVDFTTELSQGRLWRAYGWRSTLIRYYPQPSTATVVYTHGFAAGDQRLQLARSSALQLAAASYVNASPGVIREQIDDYQVQYAATSGMDVPDGMATALRRQYSRRRRSSLLVKPRVW